MVSPRWGRTVRSGQARGRTLAVVERLHSVAAAVQATIIVVGTLLVLASGIPVLDGLLSRIGLGSQSVTPGVVLTLVLAAIYLQLRDVARSASRPTQEREHYQSAMDVYPALREAITSTKRREEKVLDVIGINLHTAWPCLRRWVTDGLLEGWTVSVTAVSGAPTGNGGGLRDDEHPEWTAETERNLADLAEFALGEDCTAQRVELRGFSYDHVPVVHGFRLGTGDLYVSVLRRGKDGRVTLRGYSYELIKRDDTSAASAAVREVFESWWVASTRRRHLGHAGAAGEAIEVST